MEIHYLAYTLNTLLMLLLPMGLAIFLVRRFHSDWGLVGVGATTFIVSQVGHIPFNLGVSALFNNGIIPVPPVEWRLGFNAVFLGLSAGLWEELARYTAFRWWAKDARSWRAGLLYGAGHGGVEALIVGIFSLFALFQLAALRETDLAQVVPATQVALLQQQVDQYWSAPLHLTILGAVERILAMVLHLSLSLLVMQAVVKRRFYWVILAIGWHTLANALALVALQRIGAVGAEAILAVMALVSLGLIYALRRSLPEPTITSWSSSIPAPIHLTNLPPVETRPDDLDKSRYTN